MTAACTPLSCIDNALRARLERIAHGPQDGGTGPGEPGLAAGIAAGTAAFLRHTEELDELLRSPSLDAHQRLTRLTEESLVLLEEIREAARSSGHQRLVNDLLAAALAIGLRAARGGAQLSVLTAVVDGLAAEANATQSPPRLRQLLATAETVCGAVSPLVRQDMDRSDPGRPWRVLLVNRAIIATRTHDLDRMAKAFDDLVRYLPEEAPEFFREGMRQMDLVGYPPAVRQLMGAYHDSHARLPVH